MSYQGKVYKKVFEVNRPKNEAGIAILVSDKTEFKLNQSDEIRKNTTDSKEKSSKRNFNF